MTSRKSTRKTGSATTYAVDKAEVTGQMKIYMKLWYEVKGSLNLCTHREPEMMVYKE